MFDIDGLLKIFDDNIVVTKEELIQDILNDLEKNPGIMKLVLNKFLQRLDKEKLQEILLFLNGNNK